MAKLGEIGPFTYIKLWDEWELEDDTGVGLCNEVFSEWFDVEELDEVYLVFYDRPARQRVQFEVKDYTTLVLTLKSGRQVLVGVYDELVYRLKEEGLESGYVEVQYFDK